MFGKKFALFSAIGVVLLLGSLFVVRRWYVAAFPELESGIYTGVLVFKNSKKSVPWIVVRRPGEPSLAVAVGLVTVSAQRVAPVDALSGARQPLFIGGAEVRLRLTGSASKPGRYDGEFINPVSQDSGTWFLNKTDVAALAADQESDIARWFSLWQELEQIEGEIQGVQRTVDDQTSTIENLHRAVSEGETLRRTADVRLGRTDSEMEAAADELRARQQRLDGKLRDFDLTQRISKEGRLVFLSRETISRESRWIELTLQMLAPETSIGFDQALERAERVRGLKDAIAKEREALAAKSTRSATSSNTPAVASEEEFYERLR
ncbi:MAG: hypothetical protein ACK5GN_11380 [Pseudomonadota bacterium]|jgi:hypothetical protein